jgi:hypothetical protein
MIFLCVIFSAISIALGFLLVEWNNRIHKLVLKNRRLELELEKSELIITEASQESIREVTMAIVDFDRTHYDELYG